MNKITDEIEKELKEIANGLPVDSYTVIEKEEMTGAELRLSAYDEMPEYKNKFKEDGKYLVPVPAIYQKNHYRRLKHAFQSGGIPAVTAYVLPYLEMRKKQLQNERTKKN